MTVSCAVRSFTIGVATGLRTMTGPAAAFHEQRQARTVLQLAALAEYVVDKLPSTPARTGAIGLTARAVSAAFSGAAVAQANGGPRWIGSALAVAGAMGSAYAGVAYRGACAGWNVPPLAAAIAEDFTAIALARRAAG